MAEFESFPKIPRWNREITITEKIDGTNAAIVITPTNELERNDMFLAGDPIAPRATMLSYPLVNGERYAVYAQSRTRMITPEQDNYGFARWVQNNAFELVNLLGPGRHFGEWYGQGINRNYGLDHKRFALFNVKRWADLPNVGLPIEAVPVLARSTDWVYGQNDHTSLISLALDRLELRGSSIAPGFKNPEGIVIYHTAANSMFKITLEKDEAPKGIA
jgi:hypothetical protein